jgi:ABC-type dipeptide/oligopeptide/nickel transport system ATPase component
MAALLKVQGLTISFQQNEVVKNVSFEVEQGEIFGLVGQSGAGKSMTGRAIIRLLPPTAKVSGRIFFKGHDLLSLSEKEMRKIRGNEITLIQQDPVASLNPVFKIRDQITDVIKLHLKLDDKEAINRARNLFTEVGIPNPEKVLLKYPHQLSGGLCQRVAIAIAFACEPSLVVADEPTTALDVITQGMVVNLMKRMQKQFNTSIIFITHNLALASNICSRIAVMSDGQLLEVILSKNISTGSNHPYTRTLLSSLLTLNRRADAA